MHYRTRAEHLSDVCVQHICSNRTKTFIVELTLYRDSRLLRIYLETPHATIILIRVQGKIKS